MQANLPSEPAKQSSSIFQGVTFYHWLVVIIASCGWLFDCMDQRLFVLARLSALRELLGDDAAAQAAVMNYVTLATAVMMVGWATGGIIFGMMSDKLGRVKAMVATLLIYSGFTGLSGVAQSWVDFTIYRFLVGLGVGGMFGAATTLVAESVPGQFRSLALGSLQALSAIGNITGSVISLYVPPGEASFWGDYAGWRVLFFVGILPSLLVVPMIFVLREPEPWKKAKAEAAKGLAHKNVGSVAELFRVPRWRRHTVVGLFLGLSGMIGLWGIGFFSPELITTALQDTPLRVGDLKEPYQLVASLRDPQTPVGRHYLGRMAAPVAAQLNQVDRPEAVTEGLKVTLVEELNRLIRQSNLYDEAAFQGVTLKKGTQDLLKKVQSRPSEADLVFLNRQLLEQAFPNTLAEVQKFIDKVRSRALALQDVGAFLGMFVFTFVASFLNRRIAFMGAFILCLIVTMFVFYSLKTETDAYWMPPLMGFAQLAVFAGYSIYFPELFPTRLRGTGVGFCYNTVRYLAAPFPLLLGQLSTQFGFRNAAIMMSTIYLVGLVALIWAPETKGQPLPED